MSQSVVIPTYLMNEFGAIQRLLQTEMYKCLENRRIVVISGSSHTRKISERFIAQMKWQEAQIKRFTCSNNNVSTIDAMESQLQNNDTEIIIGVGGGKVLDVSKMLGTRLRVPVMLVPTAISSDAICSPVAVIRTNENRSLSISVDMPHAVIIDLDIVASCPPRLLAAGIGDLLSNKTALFDWKLAQQTNKEKVNTFASLIANQAVEAFLNTSNYSSIGHSSLLQVASESLIMSGIAMAIAGTSRPCSGSEHLISHALDNYCGGKALHGEQVAIGILISEFLQEQHHMDMNMRQHFKRVGLPIHYKELGYTKEEMNYAIRMAPTIRDRYTVLNEYELTDQQIDYILDEVFSCHNEFS